MRIGLVGYGHGGRFFHAPLIATLPGATFVGVVTRSPERRQQLNIDLPGVKAFERDGIAVIDELLYRISQRKDFSHGVGLPM